MIKTLFCVSVIFGFIECQMHDRPSYKDVRMEYPFLTANLNTNPKEHQKFKDYEEITKGEKTNSEKIVLNTQTETGSIQTNVDHEMENQFPSTKTKFGKDVFLLLVDCINNRNKELKTRRQFSPINPFYFQSNNIRNTLEESNEPLITNSTATIIQIEKQPTNLDDTNSAREIQIDDNLATKSDTQNHTLNEDTHKTDNVNVKHSDFVEKEKDEFDDIFDDEKLLLQNRRMNREEIEKVLSNPTRGVIVKPLTQPHIMLMQNSRVCYACSSVGNKNCWSPDRSTTVKYCRKGNDACITKRIDNESTILIRDCGNSCDENDLPGLKQKYTSCSICHYDLCNSAFTNSVSIFAITIVLFLTILPKYI